MSFQPDDFLERSKRLVREERSKEVTRATFIEEFNILGEEGAVAYLEAGPSDSPGFWAIGSASCLKLYDTTHFSASSNAYTYYLGEVVQTLPHAITKEHLTPTGHLYHAFMCHASEDKDTIVRPLANALVGSGFAIWYDSTFR